MEPVEVVHVSGLPPEHRLAITGEVPLMMLTGRFSDSEPLSARLYVVECEHLPPLFRKKLRSAALQLLLEYILDRTL